ncbi:MAG: hypothetical protein Q3M30_17620 [Candidatus Electrothrix sp. Rat3]|nr:hypothetical protein [Candidatus Electrothrix rattekaaiensis]
MLIRQAEKNEPPRPFKGGEQTEVIFQLLTLLLFLVKAEIGGIMNQDVLLELIRNGATAEPWNNGIHIKIGEKDLWTDHTDRGIEIWTQSVNSGTNSRVIVELNMIDVLISELRARAQKENKRITPAPRSRISN